jgi:hypothetical protein
MFSRPLSVVENKISEQSIYNQRPSVMQQIIYLFFPLPLSLKIQHVSALDGHLQMSQYAETATLHQCALKSHIL